MSPTTTARRAPRVTAAAWWSMSSIVTLQLVLVAEHRPPERVADEEQRDAGLVEELRRRVVVGGQHRDPLAVGVHPADVGRRSTGGRLRSVDGTALIGWISCCIGLSLRGGVALVQRRGDAVEQPVGDGPFGEQGKVLAAALGGEDRDPVRVGPEARAGLRDVVGDEQVDALAARACRRRGRASRSPRRTRRGRRASGRREVRRAAAASGTRQGCPRSARARGSGPRSRVSFVVGRAARPEVGDRGGHHQGIGRGRGRRARRRASPRRLDPDDRRRRGERRRSTLPATSVTWLRGRSPPPRSPCPSCPVERLPMKRTGSIGSAVPPAVTTTCRPARSASRGGGDARRPGGRVRGPDGSLADRRDDRVDDPSQLGQPPDARLARGERPALRLDDRVAEVVAQPATLARVAGCAHMSPSIAGATTTGAAMARQVAVTASPARPLAIAPEPVGGRGRDDDRVGACRRRRCGRSGRPAAAPGARPRPGGGSGPRTTAARRSGSPRGSAAQRRRRPRPAAGGGARRPCRPRSSR